MPQSSVSATESLFDLINCILAQASVVASQWEKDNAVTQAAMDELTGLMKMYWEKED